MRDLIFIQEGMMYSSSFTSSGDFVMQITQSSAEELTIMTNLQNLEPAVIYSRAIAADNLVLQINVPVGMTIKIISKSKVLSAKLQE